MVVTLQSLVLAMGAMAAAPQVELLEFTAPWCKACKTMEPTIQRLQATGFPIRKVDVDQQKALASQYRVSQIPAFVLVVNGKEVQRIDRPATYAELVQLLRPYTNQAAGAIVRGQSPQSRLNELVGGGSAPVASTPTSSNAVAPPLQPTSIGMPTGQSTTSSNNSSNNNIRGRADEAALAATVRIRVEDNTGFSYATGTIIDVHGQEALVVTCGHVFRESKGKGTIAVELFENGQSTSIPGQLIQFDSEERDIGLIAIRPGRPVKPAKVATTKTAIASNDRVFSIGCDHGKMPSIRHSHIKSINRYVGPPNLQVAGRPVIGRSGGGLFNASGELIGICNAADQQDDEGVYAALGTIHWQLDQIGLQRLYQSDGSQGNPAAESKTLHASLPDAPTEVLGQSGTNPAVPPSRPDSQPGVPSPTDLIREAKNDGSVEVIVIRRNGNQSSQVKVLSKPSDQLIRQISREVEAQGNQVRR